MFGIYIATMALINVMFPNRKGFMMGLVYGSQAFGGAGIAPLATIAIDYFNVSVALIVQGAIFAIVMTACSIFVTDPTKGNAKLMAKIQKDAEQEEIDEAMKGKSEDERPSMRWMKAFRHPAFWLFFTSLICIQMIGNVLVTDIPMLAEGEYGLSELDAAWIVTGFSISAGVGGFVIGFLSDIIGPYKSTFFLGIIDGILLLILIFAGSDSVAVFGIICMIQGFTYNGMTTLNPVMVMDSYASKDMGIVLGGTAVAYGIVGTIGPQIGIEMPYLPMMTICAVLSIVGGVFSLFSRNSLNKYYSSNASKCAVK
jgi:MFS family permease